MTNSFECHILCSVIKDIHVTKVLLNNSALKFHPPHTHTHTQVTLPPCLGDRASLLAVFFGTCEYALCTNPTSVYCTWPSVDGATINYISARHFILVIDMWIVHQRRCIVCYFYSASSKWRDVNPRSRNTPLFYCCGHRSNDVVGLVYTSVFILWTRPVKPETLIISEWDHGFWFQIHIWLVCKVFMFVLFTVI